MEVEHHIGPGETQVGRPVHGTRSYTFLVDWPDLAVLIPIFRSTRRHRQNISSTKSRHFELHSACQSDSVSACILQQFTAPISHHTRARHHIPHLRSKPSWPNCKTQQQREDQRPCFLVHWQRRELVHRWCCSRNV